MTTKADEMNALASRCEREEASRTLDVAIARAIEPDRPRSKYDPNLSRFTVSLDAAVTLVPDEYDWIVARANGGLTIHACVGNTTEHFGGTPALALCAAALRARAALSQTEEGK